MVKRHVKATLIPHAGNRYKPHLIRHWGLAVALVFVLGAQAVYNYQATGNFGILAYATNVDTGGLLSATNQHRAANGKSGLALNGKLSSAAQAKANHMIAHNYWSHVSPTGVTPWYFINNAGYSYVKAGENLAYGFSSSSAVVNGWMNSASHRANMLDARFKDVGFGIANGANYQGGKNTVVVAMYGQPVAAPKPAAGSTAPKQSSTPQSAPASTPSSQAGSSTPATRQPASSAPSSRQTTTPRRPAANRPNTPSQTNRTVPQRTLSNLKEQPVQVVAGTSDTAITENSRSTNLAAALLRGDASWSHYVGAVVLLLVAAVFAMRHVVALRTAIVHGENYVVAHPLLEAGLVYGGIWLILISTYGAIA